MANYRHIVRQILPLHEDSVNPLELYPADDRTPASDRPWLMVNMVSSADGASSVDGLSGGLGGEGDRAVFRAVRSSCDWILVGAQTVRDERYRLPGVVAEVGALREAKGWAPAPRLAVVSRSGDLDPSLPLFAPPTDGQAPPLIITGPTPDPSAIARLDPTVEWCHLEDSTPTAVLEALNVRGAQVVLLEGGPSVNGMFFDAELVDELCLTISPHFVGGESPRIVTGRQAPNPADLALSRLLEHDHALFARYVRS